MLKAETQIDIKFETVDRTLIVKLPGDFDAYLQGLAKALNITVESILLEEMYGVLEGFFSCSFAEGWTDRIANAENSQRLESQIKQVADIVCDC